jgi:adenosylmethionine---8-amino-7-oxononanoate aminotransferase
MLNFPDQDIDKNHVWHPFDAIQLSENEYIVKAEGVKLFTNTGKVIIDAISSWWVNLHGHCNPIISEAIKKQVDVLEHVIFAGFTHQPAIELTRILLPLLPGDMQHLFFSDNGSTSTEVALKMAFQYWYNKGLPNKKTVIALEGAYHGDNFGAMSVGGRSIFSKPFDALLFEVHFIPLPLAENEKEVLSNFENALNTENVAAFIYEPLVQGASGMRFYSPQLLEKLIKMAKEKGVICIADEVMTGFGRTGKMFASEYLNTYPDIICLSKGITGGYLPLGATACTNKIKLEFAKNESDKVFYHGHSYTANPLACAAAVASLAITVNSETKNNWIRIADKHREFILKIENHEQIIKAECLGTILKIELKTNSETGYTNAIREKAYFYFLSKGILLRPLGNIIYILPPYIITNTELEFIYATIEDFLAEIKP